MILDTNAISDWCNNNRSLLAILPSDRPLFLPAICLGEYRFGLKSARDQELRERWLEAIEEAVTILHVDSATARRYADIREELRRAQTLIPENDIWIAALVRQYDMPLLSRDKHFDRVNGLRRVEW